MKTDAASRPLHWLGELGRRYPDAWSGIEQLRAMRGSDLPDWPAWCYAPIAAGIAAVTGGGPLDQLTPELTSDAATVTALAVWRRTKGVYQFEPALLEALWETPIAGEIPAAVLKRLPEWCVYVPLERETKHGLVRGVWAHLEHDVNDRSEELRLLFDAGEALLPIAVRLGGTLRQGIESVLGSGLMRLGRMIAGRQIDEATKTASELAGPVVNLLLWLCSEEPEISGQGRPGNPQPQRVKGGLREFPVAAPRVWTVGARIGASLAAAGSGHQQDEGGSGRARPRPHIRRAHWAVRWTGPRSGDQEPVLRWIAPTLVAANESDDLPAVVHPVEDAP